jgi:FkbM family methyltransferase
MKTNGKIWVVLSVIFSNYQIINTNFSSRLNSLSIVEDSPFYRNVGYNNMDTEKNGEFNLIKKVIRENDVIFDVGASCGDWSELVVKSFNKTFIYAFEPIKTSFNLLKKNLGHKITAYNLALSNVTGPRTFMVYQGSLANNQLSTFYERPILKYQYHFDAKPEKVMCTTLDVFCEKNTINSIDFLKIDTEGAEYEILEGAEKLLARHAIRIIQFEYGGCYIDAKKTLKNTIALLNKYGYRVFRIIPEGLIHINFWYNGLENYTYSNYAAVSLEEGCEYGACEGL